MEYMQAESPEVEFSITSKIRKVSGTVTLCYFQDTPNRKQVVEDLETAMKLRIKNEKPAGEGWAMTAMTVTSYPESESFFSADFVITFTLHEDYL